MKRVPIAARVAAGKGWYSEMMYYYRVRGRQWPDLGIGTSSIKKKEKNDWIFDSSSPFGTSSFFFYFFCLLPRPLFVFGLYIPLIFIPLGKQRTTEMFPFGFGVGYFLGGPVQGAAGARNEPGLVPAI